jgi:hypothetical protein
MNVIKYFSKILYGIDYTLLKELNPKYAFDFDEN